MITPGKFTVIGTSVLIFNSDLKYEGEATITTVDKYSIELTGKAGKYNYMYTAETDRSPILQQLAISGMLKTKCPSPIFAWRRTDCEDRFCLIQGFTYDEAVKEELFEAWHIIFGFQVPGGKESKQVDHEALLKRITPVPKAEKLQGCKCGFCSKLLTKEQNTARGDDVLKAYNEIDILARQSGPVPNRKNLVPILQVLNGSSR